MIKIYIHDPVYKHGYSKPKCHKLYNFQLFFQMSDELQNMDFRFFSPD